ncbi:hypothetical protein ACFQ4K_26775 [Tistrella bauzanensis]
MVLSPLAPKQRTFSRSFAAATRRQRPGPLVWPVGTMRVPPSSGVVWPAMISVDFQADASHWNRPPAPSPAV